MITVVIANNNAVVTVVLRLRAVAAVQLVERLLPFPEVRGSNAVIGKKLN